VIHTSYRVEGASVPTTAAPRWAVIAAHAAAITPLPSAVWRLLLVFGFSAGYTDRGLVDLDIGNGGWFYLLLLSVLTELAALLTLGLVQPWGQVVPRGVPVLGGRAIAAKPVVIAAGVGAVALIVLWTPLVAWGPLLAAVTVSFARRRL
jgi:hypothetical protein